MTKNSINCSTSCKSITKIKSMSNRRISLLPVACATAIVLAIWHFSRDLGLALAPDMRFRYEYLDYCCGVAIKCSENDSQTRISMPKCGAHLDYDCVFDTHNFASGFWKRVRGIVSKSIKWHIDRSLPLKPLVFSYLIAEPMCRHIFMPIWRQFSWRS